MPFLSKRKDKSSGKTAQSPSSSHPQRGILRKPSTRFVIAEEEPTSVEFYTGHRQSVPSIPNGPQYMQRERFGSLPTGRLPSTPYPGKLPDRQDEQWVKHFAEQEQVKQRNFSSPAEREKQQYYNHHTGQYFPNPTSGSYQYKMDEIPPNSRPRAPSCPMPDNFNLRQGRAHPGTGLSLPRSNLEPFPHPNIRVLLQSLDQTLRSNGKRMHDYLDVDELLAGEIWDRHEQEGLKDGMRNNVYKGKIQEAEKQWKERDRHLHVFGAYNKLVAERASVMAPLHGFMHRLPIVVVGCIEELYRSGMKTPGLFSMPPDKVRVMRLISRFDELAPKRPLPSLRNESVPDVCALLATYITSLPCPMFHRSFFDALWAWCVSPTLTREKERYRELRTRLRKTDNGELQSASEDDDIDDDSEMDIGFGGLPSLKSRRAKNRKKEQAVERAKWRAHAAAHPEVYRQYKNEKHERMHQLERELYAHETSQIAVARLVLMSLSPTQFSIVVYLFSFFSEVASHPENEVTFNNLCKMFSFKLLGGPSKEASRTTMLWMLTRWGRIEDGFKSNEAKKQEKKDTLKRLVEQRVPFIGREVDYFRRGSAMFSIANRTHQELVRSASLARRANGDQSSNSGNQEDDDSDSGEDRKELQLQDTHQAPIEHQRHQLKDEGVVPLPVAASTDPLNEVKEKIKRWSRVTSRQSPAPQPNPSSSDTYNAPTTSLCDESIDTLVITPSDGKEEDQEVTDLEDAFHKEVELEEAEEAIQHEAFEAIESLLHPKSEEKDQSVSSKGKGVFLAPGVESDVESVYSQPREHDQNLHRISFMHNSIHRHHRKFPEL
ncbi:hypothetical protein C8Q75DRAFT_740188 [Abortiporus biennis]|nr:hypothetical protein C8Q75DRAFT_740188 [Abortiporus biennis]